MNFLVWVQTNDWAKMEKFILNMAVCCCGRYLKRTFGPTEIESGSDDVDYNNRVAVNKALQTELKEFVTQGILKVPLPLPSPRGLQPSPGATCSSLNCLLLFNLFFK